MQDGKEEVNQKVPKELEKKLSKDKESKKSNSTNLAQVQSGVQLDAQGSPIFMAPGSMEPMQGFA